MKKAPANSAERKLASRVQAPSDPPRWPNLGFTLIAPLDYMVAHYDPEGLRAMAIRVQSEHGLGPSQWAIGKCLLDLAESPAAIKELNKYTKRAPQSLRGLNLAVHYRVRMELNGDLHYKVARGEVAEAWAVGDATVQEMNTRFAEEAKREIEVLVRLCEGRESWVRKDVLVAIDADMRYRAQKLEWLAIRKRWAKRKPSRSVKIVRSSPT